MCAYVKFEHKIYLCRLPSNTFVLILGRNVALADKIAKTVLKARIFLQRSSTAPLTCHKDAQRRFSMT